MCVCLSVHSPLTAPVHRKHCDCECCLVPFDVLKLRPMRCQNTFNKQESHNLQEPFLSIAAFTQSHSCIYPWQRGGSEGRDGGKEERRVGRKGEVEGEGPQVKKKKERWQRR